MWLKGEKFKASDRRKIITLILIFLVLILTVAGVEEYRRYNVLKDIKWSIKEKETQGTFAPDIALTWMPEQNKIVMDFPLVVENQADIDVVFSKVAFDISIWGLESGKGEISALYKVPVKESKTLWIKNFEVNAKDFENFVFTLSKTDNVKVDIDISLTTYYPILYTDVESGHVKLKAEYPLEKDEVDRIIKKKLVPFIGG